MFQLKHIIKGKLNDLPEELLAEIPSFKQGAVATIKTIPKNEVLVNHETKEKQFYSEKISILLEATILYKDKRYRIGVPKEMKEDGTVLAFRTLLPFTNEFNSTSRYFGVFRLQMDDEVHAEIFTCLWLIDKYSTKNKHYSGTKLFEIVDDKKEAAKTAKLNDDVYNALTVIREWNETELKNFAASMGLETEEVDPFEIKNQITALAISNPSQFNEYFSDPLRKEKSIFKRGESLGIIAYDDVSKQLTWVASSVVIETFKNQGQDWLVQAANYAKTGGGEKVLKMLENNIKAKTKEQSKDL